MKMINNNKLYLVLVGVFLLLNSCADRSNNLYGNWRISHIIIDGNEILDNDMVNNEFNIPFYRTVPLLIDAKNDKIFLEFSDEKPLVGDFKIEKIDDVEYLFIDNCNELIMNGQFLIVTDNKLTNKGGYKTETTFLKLESDRILILASKGSVVK